MGRPEAESGPLVLFPQGPVPGQDSIYFLWLLKAVTRINENWCKMLKSVSLPAPTSSLSISHRSNLCEATQLHWFPQWKCDLPGSMVGSSDIYPDLLDGGSPRASSLPATSLPFLTSGSHPLPPSPCSCPGLQAKGFYITLSNRQSA